MAEGAGLALSACGALIAAAAVLATGALARSENAPGTGFPPLTRPVAAIVSPSWGDPASRDKADEVGQIVARMGLRPGMIIADIGAGQGYDTLRLSKVVGPKGEVIAEDVTPSYLQVLQGEVKARGLGNVRLRLGAPGDPRLDKGSIDAAIMVHMYHEISQPYALLSRLALAFKPGGRLGVEELDRPTPAHGTPPALLTCEFSASGYRLVSLAPLNGGLGYFAVFTPPPPGFVLSDARTGACKA
jgi:SAM-dependent methyltransferase